MYLQIKDAKIGNQTMQPFSIKYMNVFSKMEKDLLLPVMDTNYQYQNSDIPRRIHKKPSSSMNIKWRPVWIFKKSIFKGENSETQQFYQQCFNEDWQHCRIANIIKDQIDLEQVKKILQENYQNIKSIYKILSTQTPFGDIWCIQWSSLVVFFNKLNIYNNNFNENQLNVKFVAAQTDISMKGNHRIPLRSIIRYQFLEIFIRFIDERYIQQKEFQSYSSALNNFLTNHLYQNIDMNDYDIQRWRLIYYWNEQNDLVLTLYKPILKEIYKIFSKKKSLPGQQQFMCLDEFIQLYRDTDLLNDNLNQQAIIQCFSYSMTTQLDELYSDRHFQMSYMEFNEAFSRAAQKQPINGRHKILPQKNHLHMEIENVIQYIKNTGLLGVDFMDNYVDIQHPIFLQDGSINSDLY